MVLNYRDGVIFFKETVCGDDVIFRFNGMSVEPVFF